MSGNKYQPALLGGLFIGILSSLPLVGNLNVCCCLWVVVGGLLATYLRQQQIPGPIETSEAVLNGLIAGLIGALLCVIGDYVLLRVTGPLWQDQFRSQIEGNPDIPPQLRDLILRFALGGGAALFKLVITLPVYAVFSTLGALLGLAFFKKKLPPQLPTV
jgi:hypothetical protein